MWAFVYLLGRVAVVAIFLWSGVGKLMAPAGMNAVLSAKGFPMPMLLTYLAAAIEIVGGALVLLGWHTRIAATALVAFTVVSTLIAHDFWNMTGGARLNNQIQALKNLSMIGGLLLLMAAGPGRHSVDRD